MTGLRASRLSNDYNPETMKRLLNVEEVITLLDVSLMFAARPRDKNKWL
ncbi:hypothetical protein J2Y03_003817 [Neobacillus niacini]|nr:hypothetical protein [Neobacillus niacini]